MIVLRLLLVATNKSTTVAVANAASRDVYDEGEALLSSTAYLFRYYSQGGTNA